MLEAAVITRKFNYLPEHNQRHAADDYARWQRGEIDNYQMYLILCALDGTLSKATTAVRRMKHADEQERRQHEQVQTAAERQAMLLVDRAERIRTKQEREAHKATAAQWTAERIAMDSRHRQELTELKARQANERAGLYARKA